MKTPLEIIEIWRSGCSCAGPAHDHMFGLPPETTKSEECLECTVGALDAIEKSERKRLANENQCHIPHRSLDSKE